MKVVRTALESQFANWAKSLLKVNPTYVNEPSSLIGYIKGPNWDNSGIEYAHYRSYIAHIGNELLAFFEELRTADEATATAKYRAALDRFNELEFGICDIEFVIKNGKLVRYNGTASKVQIPTSVRSIGEKAFEGNTSIEEVYIPNTVTAIGESAFAKCRNLKVVFLPCNLRFIKENTFWGCRALESIELPSTLESIGESAFSDTKMTKVMLPGSLKEIKSFAFSGTPLNEIELPSSITELEATAFYYCPLSKVVIPSSLLHKWRVYSSCTIEVK